jgi:Cu+-exporting ATPase
MSVYFKLQRPISKRKGIPMNCRLNRRSFVAGTLATFTGIWSARPALAASPQYTWVFVKDMHCENCAKKIARRLYTLPGVVKVQTNVKQNFAVITPESGKNVSPRAVWEAVEAAKFQPVKIQAPSGVFTAKPRV